MLDFSTEHHKFISFRDFFNIIQKRPLCVNSGRGSTRQRRPYRFGALGDRPTAPYPSAGTVLNSPLQFIPSILKGQMTSFAMPVATFLACLSGSYVNLTHFYFLKTVLILFHFLSFSLLFDILLFRGQCQEEITIDRSSAGDLNYRDKKIV